jgi:hypothetical protein
VAGAGDQAIVAYTTVPGADHAANFDDLRAQYVLVGADRASPPVTFGDGLAVDAKRIDANRTMLVTGGSDGIKCAVVERGSILKAGK